MFSKKFRIIIFVLIAGICAIGLWSFIINRQQYANYKKVAINNTVLYVEIADTDAKRSQGLSGRNNMPQDAGMLFVFDSKNTYNFWMKDMQFPLDFIWIEDETIVDISENIAQPSPNQKESDLPFITPKYPVNKVLEVHAGFVKKRKIGVGNSIIFK